MMTLNIIPEKDKKELRMMGIYLMTKNIVYLALTIIIFIAIALLITKIITQSLFNNTANQIHLTAGSSNFFNNEIKIFNQELKEAKKIQESFIPWTKFIANFTKLSNEGITFNSISIVKETSEIEIKGIAKTRNSLLALENQLKNSGYFYDFEIPKKILFQKEDINFNILLKFADINVLKNKKTAEEKYGD